MLESLRILFNPVYFFYPYPGYDFAFQTSLLVGLSVVVAAGLVLAFLARKVRKKDPRYPIYSMGANWGVWGGLVGLLLVFARNQGIPYFSMRALLIFWLIGLVVWGLLVIKAGRKEYHRIENQRAQKKAKERWVKK